MVTKFYSYPSTPHLMGDSSRGATTEKAIKDYIVRISCDLKYS